MVWAHHSHLGDAQATQIGQRGELNVGQLIRERYGGEAVLVGFTMHQGTVTAASDWGDGGAQAHPAGTAGGGRAPKEAHTAAYRALESDIKVVASYSQVSQEIEAHGSRDSPRQSPLGSC